ncbi:MAG: CHASE3 domain-containing protein [Candidatus Schekmanbacteria bacterium]|nr:CHASE3 domain-containing protein [Candidatus Schekmanbacteria bacterium]
MFRKMKLSQRIFLGNILMILVFAVSAMFIYSSVVTVSDSLTALISSANDATLASDLEIYSSEMARTLRGYILFHEKSNIDTYNEAFEEIKAISQRAGEIKEPEQKEKFANAVNLCREFDVKAKEIIALVNDGKYNEAAEANKAHTKTIFDKIKPIVREFREEKNKTLNREEEEANSAISLHNIIVVAGLLFSIVVAIICAVVVSGWISRSVKESLSNVNSAAEEIAVTATEHEKTASAQAASVSETAITMEELDTSSRKVSEQAETAAEATKYVIKLAEDGLNTVEETVKGLSSIRDKADEVSKQVLKLSEQTAQIGGIATLVTDIAGQINMLAINAAVEAVRAGEHGKGFNVIAQEVRKLADQGKKAAEKVNDIVADIQKATNSTIMAMEDGTKTIDEGTRVAERTTEMFKGVKESINSNFENFKQITLNITQQAAAIRQVVESMNSLNAGAKETAAGLTQTKIGLERINESSSELLRLV